MNIKRAIVWIVSAGFGGVTTAAIIFLAFRTTLEKFQTWNVILLFLSLAAVMFIWLDYFLKTNYLKR